LYAVEELRRIMYKKGMKIKKLQFYNLMQNIGYPGKIKIKGLPV